MPMPTVVPKSEIGSGLTVSENRGTAAGVLKDFVQFVLHPQDERGEFAPSVKVLNTVKLYFFALLMMIPLGIITMVVCAIFGVEGPDLQLPSSLPQILLLIGIVSVLEELIFRLPLRFSPLNFALSAGFLAVIAGGNLLVGFQLPYLMFWVIAIGLWAVTFGMVLSLSGRPLLQRQIKGFYAKRFAVLFYGLNLLFGLMHIINYDYKPGLWLAAVFITAPQLLGGFILSYLRIRQGLLWSMVYHLCWNYLFIIVMYGSYQLALVFISLLLLIASWSACVVKRYHLDKEQSEEKREITT